MSKKRKQRLEEEGFKETTVSESLGLSKGEALMVELRVRLSEEIEDRRTGEGMTQEQLADKLGTSQSRISAMETGDTSVSIGAMLCALVELGANKEDIGDVIAARSSQTDQSNYRALA